MTRAQDVRRAVVQSIRARKAEIARAATYEFLDRHPDWLERYGDLAMTRGEEDAAFHAEFLVGAIVSDDPAAFAHYARWTAGMLAARGIAPEFLAENLQQVGAAAGQGLDGDGKALVDRMVRAGVAAIEAVSPVGREVSAAGEGAVEPPHPPSPDEPDAVWPVYLQAVRLGERRAALNIALEAVRGGTSVPEVYRTILQPAQYEVGRLWERNDMTVAQEHMATAITQYVVAQLYTHLEIPEPTRGRALVTGVRGEFHQLGANMVADVLEADGWSMRFLGTQLPHDGVLSAIDAHEPRILGISATVLSSLPAVADLIEASRRRFGEEISILVGGGAFRATPAAWRDLGADGYGHDLRHAVNEARRLGGATESASESA
jgi:methanogenic corrinoid protein MtbC1